MSKTSDTRRLEGALWKAHAKQGVFGAFEVKIGWLGKELVDFIAYKTTGEFFCYEIKVSLSDFKSKANLSFHGDFNYYVIPTHLLEVLRDHTAKSFNSLNCKLFDTRLKNSGIGLITVTERGELNYIVKAKRKHVNMGTKATLLESMTRSLNREVKKFYEKNPYWVTEEVAE
ncbi:hypothetical protein JSO02_002901 [Listeria innocua]|uniref:hypothetical protein n=1 Tax=Listeria innocua TaxID=1642 RepID=UPI000F0EC70A|nr:hypothetical protein [Listeria innocua]HAK1118256.1 hypothetical protein [Listeria monocytogenes]EAF5675898.1 hypothetical protein [Listeria innocua]EHF3602958.1 hypothetical protein [Listeria innocua]EHF3616597.1 hypothetical protein [Listeria innocua]EHF3646987.1 hypothetical protein [Listeria innocua]